MYRFQIIAVSACLDIFLFISASAHAVTVDAGLANNPDVVYDWTNGNVRIYADGANIGSFNLQSAGMFSPPADYSDLTADTGFPSGPTDNSVNSIGWISGGSLFGVGFDGPAGSLNTPYADLGNVFPTGLDQTGLEALLTNYAWAEPIGGGPGGDFDLVALPEPSSFTLAGLGMIGLALLTLVRRGAKSRVLRFLS